MSFEKQVREDFIPRMEEMLSKEKAHLEMLKNKKDKVAPEVINPMIKRASFFVEHLEKRIIEYKEFSNYEERESESGEN